MLLLDIINDIVNQCVVKFGVRFVCKMVQILASSHVSFAAELPRGRLGEEGKEEHAKSDQDDDDHCKVLPIGHKVTNARCGNVTDTIIDVAQCS